MSKESRTTEVAYSEHGVIIHRDGSVDIADPNATIPYVDQGILPRERGGRVLPAPTDQSSQLSQDEFVRYTDGE